MSPGLRVAVTGAAGYLGRPLVAALGRDERVDSVVAIDVRSPHRSPGERVEWVVRDVRDPGLAADLEGADALMHLAFVVLGRGDDAWSVNVEGSRNAFSAADRAGVGTIVHASSAAAYGCTPDNPVPLTEDSPLRSEPPFYYPQTKVAVERLLDEIEERRPELRIVRMRPVSVLGPGAPVMLGGRAFITLSDFDPLMQFLWVDDAVEAFLAALHGQVAGPFNLGAPGAVRASSVADLLGARRVRAPWRLVRTVARGGAFLRLPGGLHPAWTDMARYPIVVDASRAERELGWRPSCDCETALLRFAATLRSGREDTAANDLPETELSTNEEAAG